MDIIQNSLRTINTTLKSANLDFPSPHEPLTMESEAARMVPDVDVACQYIVAAAYQLIASVRSPMRTIQVVATYVGIRYFLATTVCSYISVAHTMCCLRGG